MPQKADSSLLPLKKLIPLVRKLQRQGKKVAFTNGCFDLLHAGHLQYLQAVKAKADCLVVALNSDASVRRLKGPGRPMVRQRERALMVGALKPVDYVVLFSQETPLDLIRALRPDLLAKGGDWSADKIVGADFVKSYGGKVASMGYLKGHSTTGLIKKIKR